MKIRGGVVALIAGAGYLLAACGGTTDAAPPTPAQTPAVTATTTAAWSDEAVTACRIFVNAVPNWALVQTLLQQNHPTTAAQWSQTGTGWALATAGVQLPPGLGANAEPEIHKALTEVNTALQTPPVNRDGSTNYDYVNSRMIGFHDAVNVCGRAGVPIPQGD